MQKITTEALLHSYEGALTFSNPLTDTISTDQFSAAYPEHPEWAVGPFRKDDSLTFRQVQDWADPTGIGWTADSIFNPSVMERDGKLYLFYRASPRKESVSSRIGVAVYDPETGWQDNPSNPVIYPTQDNEILGCEDPKVYQADGRYYMFYNGIWTIDRSEEQADQDPDVYPLGDVGCDINVAVSDDLIHWEKLGLAVPYEVSQFWAKGAVIPRNAQGDAVKIGGHYLMYLSEGCGGTTHVGRSTDMVNWTFEPQEYLDLGPLGGSLHEVACAIVDDGGNTGSDGGKLVLDFFYGDTDGQFSAAQALYDVNEPFAQKAMHRGGSLAWGGLLKFGGTWMFAQGWDAPSGSREMYFYRADQG
jgi:beta-1,2-mannosidase